MAKKPHDLEFLICLICIVFSFVGCTKRSPDPTGIYFAGTQAHAEIVRDASGNLMIKGTFVGAAPWSKWTVTFRKDKLTLLNEIRMEIPSEFVSGEYYEPRTWESRTRYELVPSPSTPGDWDLVQHDFWMTDAEYLPSDYTMPQLEQPIPSFLHRIDDGRVGEYFTLALKYRGPMSEQDALGLSELASELLTSYPNDLYIRTLSLDALLRKGDYETLEKRLTEWRQAYTAAKNPSLRWPFQLAEQGLVAKQLSDAGRNACDFATEVLAGNSDLAVRLEKFPDILHYEQYADPIDSLISATPTNFLAFQISLKVFHVEAIFRMLQGQREEALKLLAASYYLGQLLNQSGAKTIESMIGSAFRFITCRGLEIYALNCCETPEEFQHLWEVLEELNRRAQEINLAASPSDTVDPYGIAEITERTGIRHRTADTHFQLLRMAAAAKYRFVTQQVFPQNAEQFAPLLPDGPPKDPYSSNPLKFVSGYDSFTCYSVGSDEQDDRAALSYDPTNGTVSGGDIILEIPREREFPFPRDGVRAASADELRRQFPNGLPRDPFADSRERRLGITSTAPVYVYSVGPDRFEEKVIEAGGVYEPVRHYDPTNGTVSYGDLFIAIPR